MVGLSLLFWRLVNSDLTLLPLRSPLSPAPFLFIPALSLFPSLSLSLSRPPSSSQAPSPTDGSDASPVGSLSRRSYGYPVETMKVEHGGSAVGGPHIANNIGRKRLFGELSADPVTSSVSLLHERNMYPQCKIIPQDFKKSNLTKNGLKTTQSLVSEVLDVKQRLHQIEMEMLKLHSKQLAMEKKYGK